MSDFTHRTLRAAGKQVHRLGLACNFGLDADGLAAAFERGVNYVYWTRMRTGHLRPVLRDALKRDRERFVVATGPTTAFLGGSVRRGAERVLKELGIEQIDVFHLFWLGVGSAWTEGTAGELVKLREEGKIKAIGISIHDRPRAARLAEDSPIDLFMLRYNAAHPGAEREVFPHLEKRRPSVVSYTATSWRKLLARPRGWDGPVMTAADCYRFCLSNPHVDVTLCGPASRRELEENLDALAKGPLTADEDRWMREFGRTVHG